MPAITLDGDLTTDATLNFNSSTGYTFEAAKTEFTGGVCQLKASAGTDADIVTCPAIDWTGRDQISRIAITATEAVGYRHRFIFSFDGGTTWKIRVSGGWLPYDKTDVSTAGMAVNYVQSIHSWPDTTSLIVAFEHERDAGGGNGSIDQITIGYGDHAVDLVPEATATASLPTEPSWPISGEYQDQAIRMTTLDNYEKLIRASSEPRQYMTLRWDALTASEADTLHAFLLAHLDDGFLWTPVFEGAEYTFIPISEPKMGMQSTYWGVECQVVRSRN